MVTAKELKIISRLRKNGREKLTTLSRQTRIPVSTIYEKMKEQEKGIIKKHTCILDFSKLGFNVRVQILLRISYADRGKAKEYLLKCFQINNVLKINNGFDFLIEGIFRDIMQLDTFIEKMESKFGIEHKEIYYITEEIKREDFLSDSETAELLFKD